jgi:hypothetical protein
MSALADADRRRIEIGNQFYRRGLEFDCAIASDFRDADTICLRAVTTAMQFV